MGGLLVLVVLAGIAIAAAVVAGRAGKDATVVDVRRRVDEMGPARILVQADLAALTVEIGAVSKQPGARSDLSRMHDAALAAGGRLDSPAEISAATRLLDDARHAVTALGEQTDEAAGVRRPACFFDPAHGPSARDVAWSPQGGSDRDVPACAADLDRLAAGAQPEVRMVQRGARMVPWWEGGPSLHAYAEGYFGLVPDLGWLVTGLRIAGCAGFGTAPDPHLVMELPD